MRPDTGRRAYSLEMRLVVHVHDVADRESARNKLDSPGMTGGARADEMEDMSGTPSACASVSCEISFAIVLHQHLQFDNLGVDPAQMRFRGTPRRPSAIVVLIGMPREIIWFGEILGYQSSYDRAYHFEGRPPNSRAAMN